MTSHSRSIRVGSVVLGVVLAGAVVAGPASTATAGVDGKWTQLSLDAATVNNFNSADLLRLPNGSLLVGWQEQNEVLLKSAQTAIVSGKKKTVTARGTVAAGWEALSYSPKFAVVNNTVVAGYLGIHSAETGDPLNGPVLGSRSVDGVTWTPDALPLSGDGADGVYGFDLVSDGVTTYTGAIQTSTNIIKYHAGSASDPLVDDNLAITAAPEGTYVIELALARDTATNEIWAAWYNLGGPTPGIWTQRIFPTPSAAVQPPGAGGETILPDKAVAITSSTTGGIWIGYPVGYPTASTVRAWSPITGKSVTVASKQSDVGSVDLSAGPGGKLWATWIDTIDGDERIKAARSNPAKSTFGSIGSLRSANAKTGGSTFNVTGEGSVNSLEVVINATLPGDSGEVAFYHSEIRPHLTVTTSKSSVSGRKGGKITVKVTDAATPVKGAKVKFNGKTYTTKASGKVVISVKKGAKKAKKAIAVSASGYERWTSKLTIRK